MRLIDADELKLQIVEEGQQSKRYKIGDFWELNRNEIWRVIDDLPTIEERKTGKWEVVDEQEPRRYGCSECKRLLWYTENYCPNCGAKMEVEHE